jgi:hypothetical protein
MKGLELLIFIAWIDDVRPRGTSYCIPVGVHLKKVCTPRTIGRFTGYWILSELIVFVIAKQFQQSLDAVLGIKMDPCRHKSG